MLPFFQRSFIKGLLCVATWVSLYYLPIYLYDEIFYHVGYFVVNAFLYGLCVFYFLVHYLYFFSGISFTVLTFESGSSLVRLSGSGFETYLNETVNKIMFWRTFLWSANCCSLKLESPANKLNSSHIGWYCLLSCFFNISKFKKTRVTSCINQERKK